MVRGSCDSVQSGLYIGTTGGMGGVAGISRRSGKCQYAARACRATHAFTVAGTVVSRAHGERALLGGAGKKDL